MLVDRSRLGGEVVAGPDHRRYAGNEEHGVEHEVDRGLHARRQEAVKDVAAHMPGRGERTPPHVTLGQIFAGVLLYLFPQIGLWLPAKLYG